uniref:Uncharacterized protein n=1 Tax=Anas zonorhyncha TaxID=75864 RepID=A0A8B9VDF6_9AVES
MAAVFLVTLYEYSPLFYIAVVFACFLVTSGLVLGWFGLGVPVILRNSEETESSTRVLKKRMRQVKNPFGLAISHPDTASKHASSHHFYRKKSIFSISCVLFLKRNIWIFSTV